MKGLIILFVFATLFSHAQKKGDKDVNITARDTLETQAVFVYQDNIIPVLDVIDFFIWMFPISVLLIIKYNIYHIRVAHGY